MGSGKSTGGIDKALLLASVNQGLHGMFVAPTMGMLWRNVLTPFFEIYGDLVEDKNEGRKWMRLVNGSTIWWGSTDRPETLDGPNLAWYVWDEPRYSTAESNRIMVSRNRVAGAQLLQGVYTTTPPPGGWLREMFDRAPEEVGGRQLTEDIRAPTHENPGNEAGYVDTLLAMYTEQQVKAYVEGEWTSLSGLLLPEWDRSRHLVHFKPVPGHPVVYGVDFGLNWQSVVFGQYFPHDQWIDGEKRPPGTLVLFDELNPGNMQTEDLARAACRKYPADGQLRLELGACDPAGASTSSTAAEGNIINTRAWRNTLAECGYSKPKLRYVGGRNSKLYRSNMHSIEVMRGMLHSASGDTMLLVSRDLLQDRSGRGVVKAFETMRFKEDTQIILKGKWAEQADHSFDAVKYLCRELKLSKRSVSRAA